MCGVCAVWYVSVYGCVSGVRCGCLGVGAAYVREYVCDTMCMVWTCVCVCGVW